MNENYKLYCHVNKINGKKYFGITKQKPEDRWKKGKAYHGNKYLTNAFNKHGWENFLHIVLFDGLNYEAACEMEQACIEEWKTNDRTCGYNITSGGDGFRGVKHSDETKKKISDKTRGKNNPRYGIPLSDEIKRKISESQKGEKSHCYGKIVPEYIRKKISKSKKGWKPSEEVRANMSYGQRHKKPVTEETRKRQSLAHIGRTTKRVAQIDLETKETINVFSSLKEAANVVGCNKCSISMVCHNKHKSSGGFGWELIKS